MRSMEIAVWLVIRGVAPSVWSCRVKARRQTMGRAAECEICIPDDTVSRRHAQVWRRGSLVFVRDMKSRNGTFVDGVRITRCTLASGKTLKLGDVTLDIVLRPSTSGGEVLESLDSTTVEHDAASAAEAVPFNFGAISDSQRQVLRLLLQGFSEKRAAAKLCLSFHTVHTHVKHIYKQMGVRSRAELMALCISETHKPPLVE